MRETLDMNFGWRFHRGDIARRNVGGIHEQVYPAAEWMKAGNQGVATVGYPDADWQPMDLPHDFVIEGAFTPDADPTHGSLPTDVGWYRKTFELPAEDDGRRLWLEFDGVFRDCQVWVNGHLAGRHLSGYTSFSFDITEACRFGGANCVAVRADAREPELWSYEGGGIYRDVRLVKAHALHVEPMGVCIRATVPSEDRPASADVAITATLVHEAEGEVVCEVHHEMRDADGEVVAEVTTRENLRARGRLKSRAELTMVQPALWDVNQPHLYKVVTTLRVEGEPVDQVSTHFGVRTVWFDAAKGFFLNGRPLKLKGVCNHQDHAGVGVAIPPALDRWRLEQVQAMGANAIRTSHNPPSPALLDLCD